MIDRRTAALFLCLATHGLAASVVHKGEIPRGPVSDTDLAAMAEPLTAKVGTPRSPEANVEAGVSLDAENNPTLTKGDVGIETDASVTHQRSRRCADVEGTQTSRHALRLSELGKCSTESPQCGTVFL